MVRSTPVPLSNRICRFPLTVHLGGEAFTFDLCGRRLALGRDRTIDYYWMDSTGFRITRARRKIDPASFRNCVGHWWAAMRASGWDRDPDQVEHLLLAAGYAVLSGSKAVHQVFRDAHLAPRATKPTTAALADGVRGRVREAVAGRDRARVGRELDVIFDAPAPPPDVDATVMRQTLDGMLAHGRDLVREYGVEEGVAQFIGRLDAWADAKRKKGNQGWLRDFLNRFGYQCKVAFYTCFANAWIDIIPALRRDRGLDPVSEQFLRFWHTQHPSAEADVFRGQVLSLHPLSGFVMKDRALLAVAGQFFGTAAHERVFARGEADVPEYWSLVGAVLTAGHQYRQALDRHAAGRGAGATVAAWGEPAVGGDVSPIRELLEDFATSQGVRCPKCKGAVRLDGISTAAPGADAQAAFACARCRRTMPVVIREAELRSWSRRAE
jgi:hypothetical protein